LASFTIFFRLTKARQRKKSIFFPPITTREVMYKNQIPHVLLALKDQKKMGLAQYLIHLHFFSWSKYFF